MEMNQGSSVNTSPMVKANHAITSAVNTLVEALESLPEKETQTRTTILSALAALGVSAELCPHM